MASHGTLASVPSAMGTGNQYGAVPRTGPRRAPGSANAIA